MAKSKSFWGLRRGSAGSLTFSKSSKGEQITKAKITSMKNPKTIAQNVQRMQFAGVSHMRKVCNEIVNHSFEGEQPRITSLSAFTKANLANSELRQILTDGDYSDYYLRACPMAAKGSMVGQPFTAQISEGSLPERYPACATSRQAIIDGGLAFDATLTGGDIPTFETLFLRNGIQVGDWLTFVFLVGKTPESPRTQMYLERDFKFCWVRFKVTSMGNGVVATIDGMSSVFDIEAGGATVDLAYGMMTVDDLRGVGVFLTEAPDILYYAVIHSRDGVSLKQRSTQFFECMESVSTDHQQALVEAFDTALASWDIGEAYILDGGNNSYDTYNVEDYYTARENNGSPTRPRPVPAQPVTP